LEVAAREGCQLINSDTAGVVVKMSSHRLSAACVRPKGESECLWISDSRLSVTNPSGRHYGPRSAPAHTFFPGSGPASAQCISGQMTFRKFHWQRGFKTRRQASPPVRASDDYQYDE
jgi:hypothetical protein